MDNNKNNFFKSGLELAPIIIFFLSYKYAPMPELFDGDESLERIIFATKVFIPVILLSLLIGYIQTREISKMPLFTAIVVLVFGGLTIWLRDETFIKMKPTIIYIVFAFLLIIGLVRGQSYLQSLMGVALPMKTEGWMLLTKRFTLFFIFLAILNEVIWRLFSTDTWISFKTFGFPILTFVFFFAQVRLIQKYRLEDLNDN